MAESIKSLKIDETELRKKYAGFSDEALQKLLLADLYAPEAEQLPPEEALFIGGLVAERRNFPPVDVAAAKARFYKEYYPRAMKLRSQDSWLMSRVYNRVAAVAAVLLFCVMFAGTVTAYALGYNPLVTVYNLPGGGEQAAGRPQTAELAENLGAYSQAELVPKWLPEGYRLEKNEIWQMGYGMELYSQYYGVIDGRVSKIFICYRFNNINMQWVESLFDMDFGDIVLCGEHGVEHYIMGRDERRTITWTNEGVQGIIVGRLTVEEAQKIISSIYE